MANLRREARLWIGSAVVIAVLIAILAALFLPEVDLLALTYSVL